MANKRKRHSPEFKAKVALEALKGLKSSHELAREYEVHPTQIAQWKRELRDHAGEIFQSDKARTEQDQQAELSQAYEQIGRLKTELAWLQKKVGPTE